MPIMSPILYFARSPRLSVEDAVSGSLTILGQRVHGVQRALQPALGYMRIDTIHPPASAGISRFQLPSKRQQEAHLGVEAEKPDAGP